MAGVVEKYPRFRFSYLAQHLTRLGKPMNGEVGVVVHDSHLCRVKRCRVANSIRAVSFCSVPKSRRPTHLAGFLFLVLTVLLGMVGKCPQLAALE